MTELAAAILGSSELALFENLYIAYAAEARGIARAMLGDSELAADAVHSGFIEMLRYLARGRRWYDPGDARAMVLRNVRWAALKLHRTRRRVDLGLDTAPSTADDEAMWARTEARALCEQIVAGLSPSHQAVLRLRFVDGLSNPEAARQLGVTVGVFESRLQRAIGAARRAARATGLLPRVVGLLPGGMSRRFRGRRAAPRPPVGRIARGVVTVGALCGVAQSMVSWSGGDGVSTTSGASPRIVSLTAAAATPESIDDAEIVDAVLLPSHLTLALGRGQRCDCLLLFRSEDEGATWQSAPGPRTEAGTPRLGVAVGYPADPRIVVDPSDARPIQVSPRFGDPFVPSTRRVAVLASVQHPQRCGSAAAAVFCEGGATTGGDAGRPGTLLTVPPNRFVYFRPSGGVLCSPDGGLVWAPRCPQGRLRP